MKGGERASRQFAASRTRTTRVRDMKVMRIRLLGGADPLVRGRPPGRPLLFW